MEKPAVKFTVELSTTGERRHFAFTMDVSVEDATTLISRAFGVAFDRPRLEYAPSLAVLDPAARLIDVLQYLLNVRLIEARDEVSV